MIPDIIELQHELNQLREEKNENQNQTDSSSYSKIKARTANRNKDIDMLLRNRSSPCQVSEILGVHPDFVKARVAELERDEQDKKEFLQTLTLPEQERGGVFTIYQS
jgi:hypothetical protein